MNIRTLLCAATALLVMSCGSPKGEGHGSDDFKIGIAGYTYRIYTAEQALDMIQSLDVKYMSVKNFHLPYEASVEEMEAFKALCAEHGVNPYILGPIYMYSEAEVDQAFDYASRFGAEMFIGVPAEELLGRCVEKVKETGIKMAIHTHGPDMPMFPDIRDVVRLVGDPSLGIGCCMDLGHSFRIGHDPAKDIIEFKDWIYDIHIKDETEPCKEGVTWEMGRGKMDIPAIMKALRKIGYKGVVSVEFEKNSDKNPQPGVTESIGYLRGVCDAI